ncbi:hypothetical protein [Bacteroides sedimenti]|uniref:hypothetical protein n=1 Tax=Bacteroides sedimenti TaxID=2136147 RepID=UPI003341D3FD
MDWIEWLSRIFKVALLTFLVGILLGGLVIIISSIWEMPSRSDLLMIVPWIFAIVLIQVFFNIPFTFLLYFTGFILNKKMKDRMFISKYLIVEAIILNTLYIFFINNVNGTWTQIFYPFFILYILWIFALIINRKRTN